MEQNNTVKFIDADELPSVLRDPKGPYSIWAISEEKIKRTLVEQGINPEEWLDKVLASYQKIEN